MEPAVLGKTEISRRRRRDALMRALAWLAVIATCIFIGVSTYVGLRSLMLTGNPHFTLRKIEISCGPLTEREAIMEKLNAANILPERENLFRADTRRLRESIEHEITVHNALIERILPDTLRITVKDKIPVARMQAGETTWLTDAEGTLLPMRLDQAAALPLLFAEAPAKPYQVGTRLDSPQEKALLNFIITHESMTIRWGDNPEIPTLQLLPLEKLTLKKDGTIMAVLKENPRYLISRNTTLLLDQLDLRMSLERACKFVIDNRGRGTRINRYIDATTHRVFSL